MPSKSRSPNTSRGDLPSPSGILTHSSVGSTPPTLPEEMILASPDIVVMGNNGNFPLDPSLPSLFASRSKTRLKSKQVLKGEVQCTHKELFDLSNLYNQNSEKHVYEWILRM